MAGTKVYFILSCARSGSTSLAHILDTGTNGSCLSEPYPNLNIETRDMMEGKLGDPRRTIDDAIAPRVAESAKAGLIHGEKNVTYGPFIPYLHEMYRCRFIFLRRDGRDVVTSLMNWHMEVFGNIYHECQEQTPLSETAKEALRRLPVTKDDSDYARPRPLPGDPWYEKWSSLSRFEMAAWYWQFINTLYSDQLERIPPEDWISVDYSDISASTLEDVFDFLGLAGFDRARVTAMLDRRINSVWDRIQQHGRFPSWPHWDPDQTAKFNSIAGAAMQRLGYGIAETVTP